MTDEEKPKGAKDASDVAAPSIGPKTVIDKEPPEQRLARHEQSKTDAMGLDKQRAVIGGRYGPSVARQVTVYGIFLVILVAIGFGAKLAIDELDQPPDKVEAEADWAQEGVKQRPPAPLQ